MQRYQDFSMPPVAWDKRSREESTSGTLAPVSRDWVSWPELLWGCGWQAKCPVVQPILGGLADPNWSIALVSGIKIVVCSSLEKQKQAQKDKKRFKKKREVWAETEEND